MAMLSADSREKLESALTTLGLSATNCQGSNLQWGQCFYHNQPLKELYLNRKGVTTAIPLPISYQNIDRLIREATRNLHAQPSKPPDLSGNQYDPFLSSSHPIRLASNAVGILLEHAVRAVKTMTGAQLNEEANIKLSRLTLCTPERQYHLKSPNSRKLGRFGKFIVQIPVQGGYEGGILKVGSSEDASFDFHDKSDQYFYAAAFLTEYKHEWQQVERGNVAALEFDLLWQPASAITISSISLPAFATAVSLVRESLKAWDVLVPNELGPDSSDPACTKELPKQPESCAQDNSTKQQNLIPINGQLKAESDLDPVSDDSLDIVFSSVDEDYSHSLNCNSPPADTSINLLIIPLNEKYFENNFSFPSLHGRDRQMVHILQSIDFLDVHLAVIIHDSKSTGKAKSLFFQISQWIYSNISVPQLKRYSLDSTKQLIGKLETHLVSEGNLKRKFCYPVIVIQPRHQSILRCCASQFDLMLDHLESRLSSDGSSRLMRLQSLRSLGHTIHYCKAEPLKVWDVADAEVGERTRRLMKICQDLQAQKEGLCLLKLIGQDVPETVGKDSANMFYEGIRNEMVARSIVDMLVHAGGWRVFAESVLQLVTPTRLLRQLKGFSGIVLVLLEHDCLQGAIDVAQVIFSSIETNLEIVQQFDHSQIDVFVKALIALETHPDGEDLVLMRFLVPVFAELTFYQQCRLLIDLQKDNSSRLKGSPSFLIIYEKICLISLRRGLCSSGPVLDIVGQVVGCFVELGEKEILLIFIGHILWGKDNTGSHFNNFVWLENLVAAADSSTFAKDTLAESLKNKTESMKKSTLEPPSEKEDDRRAELVRFLLVLLELDQTLDDTSESFDSICLNMPENRLIAVINDLIDEESSSAIDYPSGRLLLIGKLCLSLLERTCFATEGKAPIIQAVVDIIKYFAALTDIGWGTAQKIISFICQSDVWNTNAKNLLTSTILLTPDIWALVDMKSDIVRQCLSDLMTSWIAGVAGIMDSLDLSAGPEKICHLETSLTDCFLCFVRIEKKHRVFENGVFFPIFDKMSDQQLAQLMRNVYKSDIIEEQSSLKTLPTIFELYRELCRRFLNRTDNTGYWKTDLPVFSETISCMLWLGDDDCIKQLAAQLSAVSPDGPYLFLSKLMKSEEIIRLTDSFPDARLSLLSLLEMRVTFLGEKLEEEAASAWQMPQVAVPNHPTVEHFLHSPHRKMTYSNFSCKKNAVKFGRSLTNLCKEKGYTVWAKVVGQQRFSVSCEITKISSVKKKEFLKEKENLEKMIDALEEPREDSDDLQLSLSDVSLNSTPTKKRKIDL